LFTAQPEFGEDTSALFNLLTGYAEGYTWKKLILAPRGLRERLIALIAAEERAARDGRAARIILKMNALVEPSVIDALYRASQAGVIIDLAIRGICCLRPGLPRISDNIRVTSIVDKFLEHSRIFYFENGGDPAVYLSSADWMPRNLWRRIETVFPIEDPALKTRIINVLRIELADNVKARDLSPDGTYHRRVPGDDEPAIRSQVMLQHLARGGARDPSDARPPVVSAPQPRAAPAVAAAAGRAPTPA
jgi:polyphosphate kinase